MDRSPAHAADPARRILVVDGDDESRAGFAGTLRAAGYEVAEARGVVQAMRLLLAYRPEAVVLDLVLPDGDGIEVGRATRAIVTTSRTCVVAVTSNASSIGFVDPASFGAEVILLKPIAPKELLDAVAHCFRAAPAKPLLPLPATGSRKPTSEPPA
jgi:DNA-binding response OmpR family regulator